MFKFAISIPLCPFQKPDSISECIFFVFTKMFLSTKKSFWEEFCCQCFYPGNVKVVFAIDLHEVGTIKNFRSENEDTMFSVKTELRGVRDAFYERLKING